MTSTETAGAGKASGAGRGNAAAQDALQKKLGGGSWKVKRGDTLWGISRATYQDPLQWTRIRDANPDKVKRGGDLIFEGQILDLPEVETGASKPTTVGGQKAATGPDLRMTDFGTFEVYPNDFVGPLPQTQDGIQVVRESTFLELKKEAQGKALNPEIAALQDGVSFAKPVVVTIGGEKVRVSSKAEAQHAASIIDTIQNVYGIKVKSPSGVDAIKKDYTSVPTSELDKLKTKEWEYKELAALGRALGHFAPILGKERDKSSRKGVSQEIGSVSKVDQAIDEDSPAGVLDTSTLGEYFASSTNFSMFTAGTDSAVDFKDSNKQLEGTAVHEIAHGLMKQELGSYVAKLKYWTDKYTASGDATAEAPITDYGQTNASEDLSEAVMYYFVDGATLKSKCPVRYAFIGSVVKSWTPKAKTP